MILTEGQLLFRLQDFQGAEQDALAIGDYEFAQESADIANALRELLQARRTIQELTAVVEQRNGECVRLHSELESRTVKLPEGDERDDLVISITEEIAHLQRCVERYRKEGMASTTQEMEQRLLVQQIALSVLNSAAGIKWEAE